MSQQQLFVSSSIAPGSAVQTLTGDAGGAVSPDVSNDIAILGGTGITVVGDPLLNTLTLNATALGITWQNIGASGTLAINNGYICNAGGALSFALPATSSLGDIIEIVLDGATSFTITQGAGQQIRIAAIQTTAGVVGSVTSTAQGDSLKLLCTVPDLRWVSLSGNGNPTIV